MSEVKMDEEPQEQPQAAEEQIQDVPLNRETAIQKALKIALTRGAVVKGISEV